MEAYIMIIIDRNRAEGNKWKEVTMQTVYAMLIDSENIETYEDAEINKEKLSLVFAWLPSIEIIEVDRSWEDTWLNIVFVNGERINSIYNTGLEYALCCLVEREG